MSPFEGPPVGLGSPGARHGAAGLPITPAHGLAADCRSCHQRDEMFSHPVDVVPSMDVPASFPLARGRLVCGSCHDGCESETRLRGPIGEGPGFCRQCHEPRGGRGEAGAMHAIAVGRAHLQAPIAAASSSGGGLEPDRLDGESVSCLSCHDGSVASDIGHGVAQTGGRGLSLGMPSSEHPVGTTYRPASRRGAVPLRRQSDIDRRVRLFDNRVGCGSCHSVYSQEPGLLVMPNDRSALCLTCHDY